MNVYLGRTVEILQSQSWYSFLHPQDLSHASAQHCSLCESHSWMNKQKNILSFICFFRLSVSTLLPHSSLSTFDTHSEQYRAIRIYSEKAFLTTHQDMTLNFTRSWICFDLSISSFHHTVREGGEGRAEMVVRVETADHSWVWLYMVLQLETGENPIVSNNYIIR